MDQEEERVLYLSRVGREKIFKYGTYNVVQERAITQEYPFYVKREDGTVKISYIPPGGMPDANANANAQAAPAADSAPAPAPEPAADADPEALAAAVLSSNFKVGLSQEEVDALLNGMI